MANPIVVTDLLKLLDDETAFILYIRDHYGVALAQNTHELAFRLRDEAASHLKAWDDTCREVMAHLTTPGAAARFSDIEIEAQILWCKPSVWIVAGLITKELVKEKG